MGNLKDLGFRLKIGISQRMLQRVRDERVPESTSQTHSHVNLSKARPFSYQWGESTAKIIIIIKNSILKFLTIIKKSRFVQTETFFRRCSFGDAWIHIKKYKKFAMGTLMASFFPPRFFSIK